MYKRQAFIVTVPEFPTAVTVPLFTVTKLLFELSQVIVPVTPSVNVAFIVSVSPVIIFNFVADKDIPFTSSIVPSSFI